MVAAEGNDDYRSATVNGILITARLVGEDCLSVGLRKNRRKTKMNRVRDAACIMRYIQVPS